MIVGIAREQGSGEKRVALVPASVPPLVKAGVQILVEDGAGETAGYPTADYLGKGAEVVTRADLFARADVVLQVNGPGVDAEAAGLESTRSGQVVIGMQDPLGNPMAISAMAKKGITAFSLEMVPRITRAQSMDVLSSMATVAGYQAVLEAAAGRLDLHVERGGGACKHVRREGGRPRGRETRERCGATALRGRRRGGARPRHWSRRRGRRSRRVSGRRRGSTSHAAEWIYRPWKPLNKCRLNPA